MIGEVSRNGASRKVHGGMRITMTSVDVVGGRGKNSSNMVPKVSWRVGASNGNRVWRSVEEYESESSADDFTQLSHGGCK